MAAKFTNGGSEIESSQCYLKCEYFINLIILIDRAQQFKIRLTRWLTLSSKDPNLIGFCFSFMHYCYQMN